jgi:hypothetical protein
MVSQSSLGICMFGIATLILNLIFSHEEFLRSAFRILNE